MLMPASFILKLPGLLLGVHLLYSCGQALSQGSFLTIQVREWKSIPEEYQEFLQPHYPVDLSSVRYAEKIDLMTSFDALTFGNKIYFKKKMNFRLLAHELEHVAQQKKNPLFLESYAFAAAKSLTDVGKNPGKASVDNTHSNIEYEKNAKTKAKTMQDLWNERIVNNLKQLSGPAP